MWRCGPAPSPTLKPIKRLWTSNENILARRNLLEMVQYSMKSSFREDSEKYWNFSGNSLWAEISQLQYRCFTKRLLLLKVYHKLLDLHHTGHSIYDDVVLLMRISWLVGISQKWFNTSWKARGFWKVLKLFREQPMSQDIVFTYLRTGLIELVLSIVVCLKLLSLFLRREGQKS